MRTAIIGGTGFYKIIQARFTKNEVVKTEFGEALITFGDGDFEDMVFLIRHGPNFKLPPHRINYRANLKALRNLGVEKVLASYAVGTNNLEIPPGSFVAIDQYIDFTNGRQFTFYDDEPVFHSMTEPYCAGLRSLLVKLGPKYGMEIRPKGTYVCYNGPTFKTAAEIRFFSLIGGDLTGNTGTPEAQLTRELGIHFAGLAVPINWGSGIKPTLKLDANFMEANNEKILNLFVDVLRCPLDTECQCTTSRGTIKL
jgi:5'-methylthioadenosine phosphorylase